MKVKRAFSLDADIVEFLDSRKNASKFLNHIVKGYILQTKSSISPDKMHVMDLAWGELYANLEPQITKERVNFAKQNYVVSAELVKTVHTITKRLGYKLSEKDCREYLTMKMIL